MGAVQAPRILGYFRRSVVQTRAAALDACSEPEGVEDDAENGTPACSLLSAVGAVLEHGILGHDGTRMAARFYRALWRLPWGGGGP
jgi:hypothetical protein